MKLIDLSLQSIHPNNYNPSRMTSEEFEELVAEVKHLGQIAKPVIVRRDGDGYEIVDGEHNWRAAEAAAMETIPCEVQELDDFEAMRQTYKRNQHGTHNALMQGLMFKKMMAARDVSQRRLAEEVEVSEGTIRNSLLYVVAAERLEEATADSDPLLETSRISRLTVRQIRYFLALPGRIGIAWLNGGAKIDDLTIKNSFTRWKIESTDLERVVEALSSLEGIFEMQSPGFDGSSGFKSAFKKAVEVYDWEPKWLYRKGPGEERTRADLREYTKLHFQPKPNRCLRELSFLESLLSINTDTNLDPPYFILSPDEVVDIIKVATKERSSALDFMDRLRLAIQQKTGVLPVPKWAVQDGLLRAQIDAEAPDYIVMLQRKSDIRYAVL